MSRRGSRLLSIHTDCFEQKDTVRGRIKGCERRKGDRASTSGTTVSEFSWHCCPVKFCSYKGLEQTGQDDDCDYDHCNGNGVQMYILLKSVVRHIL